MTTPLIDPFQRAVSYLRVSVTDRCDFRCVYCMSENMTFLLFAEQMLNGLQFGIMLFLMAAGLTLVFGVMGLINLAPGSLYLLGAFAAAAVAGATGSFVLALIASLAAAAAAGGWE